MHMKNKQKWNQSLVKWYDISIYFHCSIFFITSDFSIHLMHFTSELQTPITFLFVNEHTKCGYAFSLLEQD